MRNHRGLPHRAKWEKSTLLGYARLQLKQQIKADHGIEVDLDNIFISTTEALQTGAVINPVSGSGFPAGVSIGRTGPTISYHTTRQPERTGARQRRDMGCHICPDRMYHRRLGKPHTVLTHSYIKALVRQLDVGENYKARLMYLLVNSPPGLLAQRAVPHSRPHSSIWI